MNEWLMQKFLSFGLNLDCVPRISRGCFMAQIAADTGKIIKQIGGCT
jgi:hypothetical protein